MLKEMDRRDPHCMSNSDIEKALLAEATKSFNERLAEWPRGVMERVYCSYPHFFLKIAEHYDSKEQSEVDQS